MRKPTMWFLTRSDAKGVVQAQMAKRLEILDLEKNCTIYVAKTMALISFAVTVKLTCAFVFAY